MKNETPIQSQFIKALDPEIFLSPDEISEYLCPLCNGVYYVPVIDNCGHMFCKDCIEKWLNMQIKNDNNFYDTICPITKHKFYNTDGLSALQMIDDIYKNILRPVPFIQEKIERMHVKCKNNCQWMGKVKNLNSHIDNDCKNSKVDCIFNKLGCNFRGSNKNLELHFDKSQMLHNSLIIDFLNEINEKIDLIEKLQTELGNKTRVCTQNYSDTVINLENDFNKSKKNLNFLKVKRKNNQFIAVKCNKNLGQGQNDRKTFDINDEKNYIPLPLDFDNSSRGINIYKNRAVNVSQSKNKHKFVFADLVLNNNDFLWRITVHGKSKWMAFGCCIKEKVLANGYKFGLEIKNHGCFMISANGYLWNTNSELENGKAIKAEGNIINSPFPKLKTNAIVYFKYQTSPSNQLIISIKNHSSNFSWTLNSVTCPIWNNLVPCVTFVNDKSDDVSFEIYKNT